MGNIGTITGNFKVAALYRNNIEIGSNKSHAGLISVIKISITAYLYE